MNKHIQTRITLLLFWLLYYDPWSLKLKHLSAFSRGQTRISLSKLFKAVMSIHLGHQPWSLIAKHLPAIVPLCTKKRGSGVLHSVLISKPTRCFPSNHLPISAIPTQVTQTLEGTKLQLKSAEGQSDAIIVSTMMEAWEVVEGGLVADGTVKDVSDTIQPIVPQVLIWLLNLDTLRLARSAQQNCRPVTTF